MGDHKRGVVTCDECGRPFSARKVGDEWQIIGRNDCSACGCSEFSIVEL